MHTLQANTADLQRDSTCDCQGQASSDDAGHSVWGEGS